jgi:hypothetical protein
MCFQFILQNLFPSVTLCIAAARMYSADIEGFIQGQIFGMGHRISQLRPTVWRLRNYLALGRHRLQEILPNPEVMTFRTPI